MKKLLFLIILLSSCISHEYKYKIEGNVKTNSGYVKAIAYADTIERNKDSVWYYNSNGSKVTIISPKITEKK
jgi:hypothetical protein